MGALLAAISGAVPTSSEAPAPRALPPCDVFATAHGAAPPATLADFAWLEGTWQGEGPGGATAEVHYLAPRARVLPSIFEIRVEYRRRDG